DLAHRAHARAHVRNQPHARRGKRVLDGARDLARAQATRSLEDSAGTALTPPRRTHQPRASNRAMRTAAARLDASALPVPAMSNAVPWSGLVRTNGRPSVTFTPCSTPKYFTGIKPWSWYMATTTSNSPGFPFLARARMNTVSGA